MDSRAIINIVDNLESTSATDALSANQGRVLKELIEATNEKNIMTAKLDSNVTTVAGLYTNLSLTLLNSVGSKLTLENGGIKIGSGVSKVKINADLKYICNAVGNKHSRILKNTASVAWANQRALSVDDEFTISIGQKIIDVQEGDVFYLAYYAADGDVISTNYNATYLTVEVVE